jgi:starch-binding outer membrane protein, SusD/RagB family
MKAKRYSLFLVSVFFVLSQFSCMEYLDKTELADITSEDVFKEFNSFQGFVETMYAAIVLPQNANASKNDQNFGDDVEGTYGGAAQHVFQGNYLGAITSSHNHLIAVSAADNRVLEFVVVSNATTHNVWGGWQAIRAANTALANLDKLENATQEEYNLLAGQCYFFRAYFHWEIMRAWGSIPYIDEAMLPSSDMKIPVLKLNETVEKVMDDLGRALDLLPVDWELTEVGSRTVGNNAGRLTKGMALAMRAEVMLFMGSPLFNGTVTRNFNYDEEYLKRSAAEAWEVIKLADQKVYELEPYETISDVFYTINRQIPGKKELIFSGIPRHHSRNAPGAARQMLFAIAGGGNNTASPNAKYVENYGMANGLPIHDPESGYDPSAPFTGRDPRFYNDLRIDRSRNAQTINDARAFAQLYVGGRDKSADNSRTGYGYKKFIGPTCNTLDNGWGGGANYWTLVPRIRLAEIYLIYAEAVNEAYGPNGTHPGAGLTAVQAINIVRNRAGVPDVHSKYTTSKELFRERIRNERAVELAFEFKRWFDIRRWYIAHLEEYKTIYYLNFDKDWTQFETIPGRIKVFDLKHYWMPFPVEQVNIYKEWPQNPGW